MQQSLGSVSQLQARFSCVASLITTIAAFINNAGSEASTSDLLNCRSHGYRAHLIANSMARNILTMAVLQLRLLLGLQYASQVLRSYLKCGLAHHA
jgi:hypothetical protein